MPDHYSKYTVEPNNIPINLISDENRKRLEEIGVTIEEYPKENPTKVYLFGEHYDEGLPEILQDLIKSSNGEIVEMTISGANTASKMAPGSQGGFAFYITATKINVMATGAWLAAQKNPKPNNSNGH